MRGGFSFIEVLISIAILSFLGTALIKFNSFNKRVMEKNILNQESILISSSILFEQEIQNDKDIELFDLVKFENLDDEDMKFLKSVKLRANREFDDKLYLGNNGKDDLYLEYGDLSVTYKNNTQKYLWMQKEE
jgi:prepilin-type N-terminal cleavage/methylation domain-containing protein